MENIPSKKDCIKILRSMGFKESEELGGDLHKDFGGFHCMIWFYGESIKLSVYGKEVAFSDDDYIGPPLPDEAKLRAFANYNTA